MKMKLWQKSVIVGVYNFVISLVSFYLSLALRFDTLDFSKEIPKFRKTLETFYKTLVFGASVKTIQDHENLRGGIPFKIQVVADT